MFHENSIRQKYLRVKPFLNERARRCWAAAEAKEIGWGGISLVAKATKMHRDTIAKGMKELKSPTKNANKRLRRAGAGRKPNAKKDPALKTDLERLVEPATRGDPESALKYTSKSLRKLANDWPTNFNQQAIKQATNWSLNCFARRDLVYKPIRKHLKVQAILTVTHNLNSSMMM